MPLLSASPAAAEDRSRRRCPLDGRRLNRRSDSRFESAAEPTRHTPLHLPTPARPHCRSKTRRTPQDRYTPPTLDVDDVAVFVHGPPQILQPPLNLHENLVQIPRVAHAVPAVPQPTGVVEPERQTPLSNRLILHGDAAFGEQILDISETEAEAVVEPGARDAANDILASRAGAHPRWHSN